MHNIIWFKLRVRVGGVRLRPCTAAGQQSAQPSAVGPFTVCSIIMTETEAVGGAAAYAFRG